MLMSVDVGLNSVVLKVMMLSVCEWFVMSVWATELGW